MSNGLATLAVMITLLMPIADEGGKIVTVTGRAVGTTPVAQEEAQLDALREAVKRVCGTFINAQTEMEDFAIVRDKVLEQPVGFARVVEVVKGPSVIGGEITEVQIRAEVFPVKFERRWAEFAHIKQREGNPRCVIVIIEDDDVDDATPARVGGIVQTGLENFFLSKDVRLMHKGTLDQVRQRDLQLAIRNNAMDKAAAMGASFKADVVVIGTAEAQRGGTVEVGGRTLKRWSVKLSLQAVQTDSAAMLVADSYDPGKPYLTTSGTGKDALADLAEKVAPKVLEDIGKAWRKNLTVGRTIQVDLEPCTRRTFKAVQEAMSEWKGVIGRKDGVRLRELVNEVATVDVSWKYNINQLADRLEELELQARRSVLYLEITEQTKNRLTVRVIEEAAPAPRTPVQQERVNQTATTSPSAADEQ